jgi:uncharacterized membrane protein YgcG
MTAFTEAHRRATLSDVPTRHLRRPARHRLGRLAAALVVAAWVVAAPLAMLAADDPGTPGPPFPDPVPGQVLYDHAEMLAPTSIGPSTLVADRITELTGGAVVVYTQVAPDPGPTKTGERAAALLEQWAADWPELDGGVVVFLERNDDASRIEIAYAASPAFEEHVPATTLDAILREAVRPVLRNADPGSAATVALARLLSEIAGIGIDTTTGGVPGAPADAPPPGPPYPEPQVGRAVYDYAEVFRPETIATVEATIDRIEERTGAEIVVYTQVVEFASTEGTERHAIDLIDQWGVGRAGFDDGLAIFFDFLPGRDSGQVQLYAAPGFAATFLTNTERQAIFENDMLPHLRVDDFDQGLLVAMDRIDAATTPENAARLERGRQLNAVVGLMGTPIAVIGLIGWAAFSWLRYGKDPVYLDSPSIYLPAPPPDLTAASGALIVDGKPSRRALTTAMLDLASRGIIGFREESGLFGLGRKVGVEIDPPPDDEFVAARRERNARRPIGPAEKSAAGALQRIGKDGYIEPSELLKFGTSVATFDSSLEGHVVRKKWFTEKPSKVVSRWVLRGSVAAVGGIVLIVAGFNIPMSGLVLVGGGLIVAGVVIMILARFMPSVTMSGAMIRAMLAAYRRTLKKTMEQSRSMDQVVADAGLDWLDTPDQAIVWGTALGLQEEIEDVLKRSLDDVEAGRASTTSTYFPGWYHTSDGGSFASAGQGGGGIFSSSGVPSIGGMMSALGTIGNSPSSSGSGGGGFSGGSSGGGGGGAGGGF